MNDLVRGGIRAWFVWFIAVSFVLLVFALQTSYAITNVYVAEDLKLTLVQVGIIGSIYTWIFAIAQFASGSVLDRIGAQRVLPFAAAFVTAGAFLFASAPNIWVLLLAQVLLAIGASYGFIGAGFVGGQWFAPAKYGFMFALVQLFASLSAVAGQRIINVAVQDYPWTSILNTLGVLGVIIILLMLAFLRDPEPNKSTTIAWPGLRQFFTDLLDNFNTIASIRDAWVNALIGGATFGSMLALGVVWGPRLLIAAGMEQTVANEVISFSWFGLALGSPVIAWASDKWRSRKKPMALMCFLQLIVIAVILISPGRSATEMSVLFFLWGFMAGGSMIAFTIGMELADKALVGTSAAMVNATQFIAGGILMAIPGRVLAGSGLIARVASMEGTSAGTVNDFQVALVIYPLALAAALLLFLFLNETHPEHINH